MHLCFCLIWLLLSLPSIKPLSHWFFKWKCICRIAGNIMSDLQIKISKTKVCPVLRNLSLCYLASIWDTSCLKGMFDPRDLCIRYCKCFYVHEFVWILKSYTPPVATNCCECLIIMAIISVVLVQHLKQGCRNHSLQWWLWWQKSAFVL